MNQEQRQQLAELLAAHFDGTASPADALRLQELLEDSPQAQAYLAEYCQMHSMLLWEHGGIHSPTQEITSPAATSPPASSAAPRPLLTLGYWRAHPGRFAALALSLTLVFWAGIYAFVFLKNGVEHDTATTTDVATVTNMRGVHWAVGTTEYQPQDALEAGDTIHLTAGFVEVTFEHGAVVLLEAPVEFTVETRGAGSLEHGRLVARIEKQAERAEVVAFSITTPIAQIIDLGTEFGVEVGDDGTTSVEVLQGRVEANPLGAVRLREARLILHEGQFARLLPEQTRFEEQEAQLGLVREMPDEEISQNLVWIPPGLSPGDTYQLAYVTSKTTMGRSADIADYNRFVDEAMSPVDRRSPYGAITWYAIASTVRSPANANAVVRAPVYDLQGNLLATGNDDFWDGSLLGPIDTNELGETVIEAHVWTGSSPAGEPGGAKAHPLGVNGHVTIGTTELHDEQWIAYSSFPSVNSYIVYGLSEVLTVPDTAP